MDDLKAAKKEIRQLRSRLKRLTLAVRVCTTALDVEMLQPSSPERGSRIAKITNNLELENDMARRFSLGILK